MAHILSPRHFVEIRRTLGGPAPEETARAAGASRQQLEADEAWWSRASAALAKRGADAGGAERRVVNGRTPDPNDRPPDADATTGPVSDAGIKRAYVRVVVIWLAVLAALWWLQHAFV